MQFVLYLFIMYFLYDNNNNNYYLRASDKHPRINTEAHDVTSILLHQTFLNCPSLLQKCLLHLLTFCQAVCNQIAASGILSQCICCLS